MTFRTAAAAALCFTFALAALPARTEAAASPLKALTFSASAKLTLEPAEGQILELDADYWVDQEKLRTEITDQRSKTTFGTIIRDKMVYSWTFGDQTGRKAEVEEGGAGQAATFADIADCLSKGKKTGDEEIDGVACDRWTYKGCGGEGETTVWIAKQGGWAKKLQTRGDNGSITSVFRGVELKPVPEERFNPPARIPFIGTPKAPASAKGAPAPKK